MSKTANTWLTRGFDCFREGVFGNGGQNLYVSKAGILQRIHHFDLNKDGHIELLFCNAQEHLEAPPAYVYSDVLGSPSRSELPSGGSPTAVAADLTGDGYDDLVIGMQKSGNAGMFNAYIYFGSPEGLTERYQRHIPAHVCTSLAAGDFNGDGKSDLALLTQGKLRIFYQGEFGFEPKTYTDLDITADQFGACDLDGDGYADLYALSPDAPPRIYWGSPDGISPDRFTDLQVGDESDATISEEQEGLSEEEKVGATGPIAKIINLNGIQHVFVPFATRSFLVPVNHDRSFSSPLEFKCSRMLSVANGDINNDGHIDLVFAGRDQENNQECSWIYWGSADGFSEQRRTPLPSHRACDVAVGDLNGNGFDDVALCQTRTDTMYSIKSPIFCGTSEGIVSEPVWLNTEGARRVFIARTSDDKHPQVIFINQTARNAIGDVDSYIYYGGKDGFRPDRRGSLAGRGATGAIACDFKDHGWADIVLTNSAENAQHLDPGTYVFRGGPEGFAYEPDEIIKMRKSWDISVGDIDHDGYLEVIIARFYNADISIYRGTPEGFELADTVCAIHGPVEFMNTSTRRIRLADMNNDGWLDLIVSPIAKGMSGILWGGPDGFTSDRMQVFPIAGNSGVPQARDLTGNGYLDLIIGGGKPNRMDVPHDSFIDIFWNGPDGMQPHRHTQLESQGVIGLCVADFNNDGYPDIFCTAYKNQIDRDIDSYIYWGGPGATYTKYNRQRIRTHSSAGCIAADFNEDGYIDLAIANHKTFGDHMGDSFVLWNGPNGFDEQNPTRLPTSGPHGMQHEQPYNLVDGGNEEYYTSAPFKLPEGEKATSIAWDAELPPKTWVKAQIRFGGHKEMLGTAPWTGPDGENSWFENSGDALTEIPKGSWVQYRLAVGATNSGCTPRITEVRVTHQ